MDTKTLQVLLDSQERSTRGFIELYMKQTEDKLKTMQGSIADLTRSLEYTQQELEDMKQKEKQQTLDNKTLKKTVEDLDEKLQASYSRIKDLEDRSNYLDDYSRRLNVQIVGIEERSGGETWEQSAAQVSKLLEEKLELPNVELERAHRVGQRQDNRDRPIVARFTRYCDREAVMRNVSKLKGTRIFINEDLCRASQEVRKMQLPLLKQAKSEGKIAYFRHTKLIIKDRRSFNEPHEARRVAESGSTSSSASVGGGNSNSKGSSGPAVSAIVRDGGSSEEHGNSEPAAASLASASPLPAVSDSSADGGGVRSAGAASRGAGRGARGTPGTTTTPSASNKLAASQKGKEQQTQRLRSSSRRDN